MRYDLVRIIFRLLILISLLSIIPVGAEESVIDIEKSTIHRQANQQNSLFVQKTLIRKNDPLVVSGDLISLFHGVQNQHLRLFSHNGNQFSVIPFQIDERDPEGEFILTIMMRWCGLPKIQAGGHPNQSGRHLVIAQLKL